jgi:nucleoside-triphosphatase
MLYNSNFVPNFIITIGYRFNLAGVHGLGNIIVLTGPSGVGKTTVFCKTIKELTKKGLEVGGTLCREVREEGVRVGFELMDLSTEQCGWLAHVGQNDGPKIGKYTVNLIDIDVLAASAIVDAVRNAEVLAIDEVGPMELLSAAFSVALVQALESGKPLLVTVHSDLDHPLVKAIKTRKDAEVIQVTYENRTNLHTKLAEKLMNQYLIC